MMKLIYRLFFVATLIFVAGKLSLAQQDPMFSQYMHNPVSINPAYAGSSGYGNITSLFRRQWVGIDKAPNTTTISFNSPFIKMNVGLGLTYIYDRLGPSKQNGLYVDYAYHIKVGEKSRFSMGLKGGFNHYHHDLRDLNYFDPDGYVESIEIENKFLPNFGLGIYYYSDHFFAGASIPKLLRNSLIDSENDLESLNREERHYFLMGGGLIELDENLKFRPTFTSRFVAGSPASIELTGTFILYDLFWIGAMYRFGDSFGLHARYQLSKQFQLGYSYDMTRSRLANYNAGSHEIYLSFDFAFKRKKIMTPRFF